MNRLILLILLSCVLRPMPASSAPPDQEHFEAGTKLFREKLFLDAAAEFRRAWETRPDLAYLFNLALSYDQGQSVADAAETYGRYLDENASGTNSDFARRRLAAIEARLTRTHNLVRLQSAPPGAVVRLDGTPLLFRTPIRRWVPLGRHSLSLALAGHDGQTRELEVTPGPSTTLDVDLAATAQRGRLILVSTPPGARILVDGAPAGVAPLILDIEPGRHTVAAEIDDHEPWVTTVEVSAGAETSVQASPSRRRAPATRSVPQATSVLRSWWLWTAIGAAVAGGTAALVIVLAQPADAPPQAQRQQTLP